MTDDYTPRHREWLDIYEAEFAFNRKRGCFIEEADKWARETANYRVAYIDDLLREYNE